MVRLNGIRRVSTRFRHVPFISPFMRSARAPSAAHAILSSARHRRQAISCVRNCWLTESAFQFAHSGLRRMLTGSCVKYEPLRAAVIPLRPSTGLKIRSSRRSMP
jgi:hypothetical protein